MEMNFPKVDKMTNSACINCVLQIGAWF